MLRTLSAFVAAACCLSAAPAAPASIGFARSTGEFRVDGSLIRGNSTLFEGSLVETAAARSVVQWNGGQVTLAPQSRLRVFRGRSVLEKGSGLWKDSEMRVVEAQALRITPAGPDSVVQVEVAPPRVSLVARAGSAQVRNASGVLVASLLPGVALAIDPQAGAAPAVSLTGIVVARDGKFFLTDLTTNVTVELQGPDVAKFAGKTVEVIGSSVPGAAPAAGATQLVQVATIKAVDKNRKKAAGAAGAGAAGAAGGGAGAGLSTAAVGAIIGGVAVGGTLIGLAAAGTFSGGSTLSQP